MTGWDALDAELAQWDAPPTLWWRDDDAQKPTAALERLSEQAARHRAPLHLAVIPEGLSPALAPWLAARPHIWSLQHGLRHKNHEPKGLRASEVGISRDLALQEADLKDGWTRLQGLPQLLPVFVPPWTRIAPATEAELPKWGFPVLSNGGARAQLPDIPGLQRFNIHFDPILWKGGARFRGVERTLKSLIAHLAWRRAHDPEEPTGMVTHHLETDADTWAFQEELLVRLAGRVRWVSLPEVMEC
ncbi:MAG: polysaccharide deacetylase family protein [Pseudomonadota bacterium]